MLAEKGHCAKSVQIARNFSCIQTENGDLQCVIIVHIERYSGTHFSTLGLNTEIYSMFFRFRSKCEKMQSRVTSKTNTSDAVLLSKPPYSVRMWENTDQHCRSFLRNLECYNKIQLCTCLIRVIRQATTRGVLEKRMFLKISQKLPEKHYVLTHKDYLQRLDGPKYVFIQIQAS